ncbi:DUF1918 domain-containing protein [Actinokineospora guangxiensis]|uniref:DUF1918 domain-containing protein n=1 Tax=Actinokineospora guangxiensis TaxID=1490288 RepID=A0ABW0EKB7_9PSEU
MHARPGDWLIVERQDDHREARRGRVDEVTGADGGPPFLVHWTDTDRRALVYPGSDAHVLTPDEIRARDDSARARADRLHRATRTRR